MLKPVWEVVETTSSRSRVRCNSLSAALFAKKLMEVENPTLSYEIKQFRIFDETALENLVENGLKNIHIRYTKDNMMITTTEITRISWQLTHSGNVNDIIINENFDGLNVTFLNMVQPLEKAKDIAMAMWTAHPQYSLYMDAIMSWRASDTVHYTSFRIKNLEKVPSL